MTRPCDCPQCTYERSDSPAPFIPFGVELLEIHDAHPNRPVFPDYDSLSVNSDQEPTHASTQIPRTSSTPRRR